jgi:hypothetical protein
MEVNPHRENVAILLHKIVEGLNIFQKNCKCLKTLLSIVPLTGVHTGVDVLRIFSIPEKFKTSFFLFHPRREDCAFFIMKDSLWYPPLRSK